jgi:hypothetical protein
VGELRYQSNCLICVCSIEDAGADLICDFICNVLVGRIGIKGQAPCGAAGGQEGAQAHSWLSSSATCLAALHAWQSPSSCSRRVSLPFGRRPQGRQHGLIARWMLGEAGFSVEPMSLPDLSRCIRRHASHC